jgi:hypothetical protein
MSEEFIKAFTVRQLHWLPCAMHEPLVLPPAFDLARCTISPLNAKNGSPARDAEQGGLHRGGGGRRSPSPPFLA